jgi:riboflavin kinase / FMN adenylyltransferase
MKIIDSFIGLADAPPSLCLALGVFDGVHLGHQAVIEAARQAATALGHPSSFGVLTFVPHPIKILAPHRAPRRLTVSAHRRLILARLGLPLIVELPFDTKLASLPAADFLAKLASSAPSLAGLSVGESFRFGKDRGGDLSVLEHFGRQFGFSIQGIPPVLHGEAPISSTRIRAAIETANLPLARQLLGRHPSVFGTVSRGRQLGRQLGFPTANLVIDEECLPPHGVYAVLVDAGHGWQPGVANLGTRPTINEDSNPVLEAHLFDSSVDLYDHSIEVAFVEFIRPEQRFPSLDALRSQIARDLVTSRTILARTSATLPSWLPSKPTVEA